MAHPALTTAGKELLGYRDHEMKLNPESGVYARERGRRDLGDKKRLGVLTDSRR